MTALRKRLGNFGVEVDRVGVIAFNAVKLVASLQHAIEFVDQHRYCLVAFVRLNGRVHVRAMDLDVALRLELGPGRGVAIALQFHAHSHDALLMTKQSLGFLADERLQGRCQIEVNAGYD